MHGVGMHDVFVGGTGGEELTEDARLGFRAFDDAHTGCAALRHFGHLGGFDDACVVDLLQHFGHMHAAGCGHIVIAAPGQVGAVCGHLCGFGLRVLLVEGEKVPQCAVAFGFHFFCGLIDGEVEGGDE